MASLASSHPDLILEAFRDPATKKVQEQCEGGLCSVRLFDVSGHWHVFSHASPVSCASLTEPWSSQYTNGKFVYVLLDDLIPVYGNRSGTEPIFMNDGNGSTPLEIWPMLLEKAFAKLCGSYAFLGSGRHTSPNGEKISAHAVDESMVFKLLTGGDVVVRRSSSAYRDADVTQRCELDRRWRDADELAIVLADSPQKTKIRIGGTGGLDADVEGVIGGHGYSVVHYFRDTEPGNLSISRPPGERLLVIRNPHGEPAHLSETAKLSNTHGVKNENSVRACALHNAHWQLLHSGVVEEFVRPRLERAARESGGGAQVCIKSR